MKKLVFLIVFFIVITVFFCSCTGQRNIQLRSELPDTSILDKSPLKVALYIPDSTRNYTQSSVIPSRCGMHDTRGLTLDRFGEIFTETVQGTLSQVFKEVRMAKQPVEGGSDLILQAEFNEFAFKPGCRPDPVTYFVLKGSFRAVDANGTEIWRSPVISSKVEAPIEQRYRFEKVVPSALASMIGSWVQGLMTAPEIKKLSSSRTQQ